jgi:hypothetical protein
MLPFALAHVARGAQSAGRRRALLAGTAIATAVVIGFSFAFFGGGSVHLLVTLVHVQSQGGIHSIPGLLLTPVGSQALNVVVHSALDFAFLGVVAMLARRIWTGRLDWITAAGWGTLAMLCTAGLLLPWYVGWLVPLAALSSDRRLMVATVSLTGLGLTTL